MNIINEKERFYGYIVGLHVERCLTSEVKTRLFATFEYSNKVTVWEVPDSDLFQILASHLSSMAVARYSNGEYGYEKLWIKKEHGQWRVDLP